jgi:hypothetical protein
LVLLGLAFIEAACVLVLLSRAVTRRPYQRIGPEPALRTRLGELQTYDEGQGTAADKQDGELLKDMRPVLLDSYTLVTPSNRSLNLRRYKHRAWAAINLVGSLIFAPPGDHCDIRCRQVRLPAKGDPMNKPLHSEPHSRKPSGAITYTVNTGANVFPSIVMSDKAFVRVPNGQVVIFQEFIGHDKVAVSVGGQDRVLPRAEWRALPVYEG